MSAVPGLTAAVLGAISVVAISANAMRAADLEHVDPTFDRWCVHCHGSGPYMAGTIALEVKYQGAVPALLQQRTDLTETYLKAIVRQGVKSMPPFRKTEISDAELDALAKYLAEIKSTKHQTIKPALFGGIR